MTDDPTKKSYARIHTEFGRLINGPIQERHDDGTVTIRWGGLTKRGKPLTDDEVFGDTP